MSAPGLWDDPRRSGAQWEAVWARLRQLFGPRWKTHDEGQHLEQYAAHLLEGEPMPSAYRRPQFLASQREILARIIEQAGAEEDEAARRQAMPAAARAVLAELGIK